MKVVSDTNIFISAFVVRGSLGERAFLFAQQKRFDLPLRRHTGGNRAQAERQV
jgi:hypothetical protein